jgi:hypothetical protein
VDPRTDLDDVEKRKFLALLGLELRPLGRPARSQSLYRLRYPEPHFKDLLNMYSSYLVLALTTISVEFFFKGYHFISNFYIFWNIFFQYFTLIYIYTSVNFHAKWSMCFSINADGMQ